MQILDLDDLIEQAQVVAAEADQLAEAVTSFTKLGLAGATAGGVILNEADIRALFVVFDMLKQRTAAAHDACLSIGFARLGGVA